MILNIVPIFKVSNNLLVCQCREWMDMGSVQVCQTLIFCPWKYLTYDTWYHLAVTTQNMWNKLWNSHGIHTSNFSYELPTNEIFSPMHMRFTTNSKVNQKINHHLY